LKNSFALIGIGNIMFSDDGLGIYAAEYLKRNFIVPDNLTILDGGGLGFTLMTYFSEYKKVFIVSTTSEGKNSGDIFRFGKDELISQGATRQSANEVEVVQMIEICSILDEDMADVEIVAMKPDDIIPVEANLTQKVQKHFPKLIEKVIRTLKDDGIDLIKKDKEISLKQIIKEYANPTQQIHI
jgi:hydrogenase maturation protease